MGLSGVQRTLKFVKYLPQNGWRPIVLTTSDSKFYAYDYTLDQDIPEEAIVYQTKPTKLFSVKGSDNDKPIPVDTPVKYPSAWWQKLKRIVSLAVMQPDSRKFWKQKALDTADQIFQEHKIDVVFASGPPFTSFLVARELSLKYNVSYILDYRDLWVDNAYYYYITIFHKRYAQKLEKLCLQRAERITVINREMKESLLRRYNVVSHEDISILPHGFDSEDFDDISESPDPKLFTLTHSGLFPDDLTPKHFLKAIAQLMEEDPDIKSVIRLIFVGIMKKQDLKLIKKLGLSDITTVTGYVSHSEAVTFLMKSDVLWMMIPNNIVTPSRLYEYIGSGKPLLVSAVEGGIRQLADNSGAAITTDPDDIIQIKKAVQEFYNKWQKGILPNVSDDYKKSFDRKTLTEQLSKELLLSLRY